MDRYQDYVLLDGPGEDEWEAAEWNGEEDREEDQEDTWEDERDEDKEGNGDENGEEDPEEAWDEGEDNPEKDDESEEPSLESLIGITHEMHDDGYQQQRDDVVKMIELKGGEYTIDTAIEMFDLRRFSYEALKFVLDLAARYDGEVDPEVVERISNHYSMIHDPFQY